MTWAALTLGGIDLTSGYNVLREGDGGLRPAIDEKIVAYGGSDGARLAYSRETDSSRNLHVEILGSDIDDTKAKETALKAKLLAARNYPRTGTAVTYVEQSVGETTAETWKVLSGHWERQYDLLFTNKLIGTLTLRLSKT